MEAEAPKGPTCGHSACSQSYIESGSADCVEPMWAFVVGNLSDGFVIVGPFATQGEAQRESDFHIDTQIMKINRPGGAW